jgi:hypothetical protein
MDQFKLELRPQRFKKLEQESVSLRSCDNLKTLKCNWKTIYPKSCVKVHPDTINHEQHPQQVLNHAADFDLHAILPPSLESLHLEGQFTDAEWEDICKTFEVESPLTPKLRNVFLGRIDGTFAVPLLEDSGSEPREKIHIHRNPLVCLLAEQNW